MILLCTGQRSTKAFDAMLLFAVQLDSRGHEIAIDARFLPDEIQKHQKYEVAPFLCDLDDLTVDMIVLIGAETVSEEVQILLRKLQPGADVAIWALGRFSTRLDQVTAQNRIAYALGREPQMIDLAIKQKRPLFDDGFAPLAATLLSKPAQRDDDLARLFVYLPFEVLEEPITLPDLGALNHSAGIDLHIITNGEGKDLIRRSRYSALSVHGYGELPPATLARYADIVAYFGASIPGERMALFALEAMGAGKVVIDCTVSSAFATNGAPVLRGPEDVRALSSYLTDVVLQNRMEIGRRIQKSEWLRDFDIVALETEMQLNTAPAKPPAGRAQTVFFPTNGNGLGHAQRCALIAEAMAPDHRRCFTAFPSCNDMLQKRGFACAPMVQISEDHPEKYAHDLINYLRLRSILRIKDQLVFDGGYVFDSVYRVISALQIPSVWIRRGLWRPGQIHPTALEREHVFSKIIVPKEAFSELNKEYSFGSNVHHVGPIVNSLEQDVATSRRLRDRLSKQFNRKVNTLVVSMLGGGVASERSAQLQMLCNLLEQRPNCLHLIVAWPNAFVPNGIYGWKNTQVIRTQNAQALCRAADLTISAAGYNSFHEVLYSKVPAIFIPQSAPFLDDQEKRARAASERGLASLVLDTELLLLQREVGAFLDGGKAEEIRLALETAQLPDPGNRDAALLIEEGLNR